MKHQIVPHRSRPTVALMPAGGSAQARSLPVRLPRHAFFREPMFRDHLVIDLGKGVFGRVLATHIPVKPVLKHVLELGAGHEDVSVEHLITAALADELLQTAHGRNLVIGALVGARRDPENAEVDEHLAGAAVGRVPQKALARAMVEQANRAHPEWVDTE